MLRTVSKLTLSLFAAGVIFTMPAAAEIFDKADCDAHAAHIDQVIGAEKALDAYHVLHGDKEDDHHIIDELKETHPDVEHELEDYVASGCSDENLKAHAHDHVDDGHH